jgi:preprotein translocase subunit SecD
MELAQKGRFVRPFLLRRIAAGWRRGGRALVIEIVDAQATPDLRNNENIVSYKMLETSGKLFAELTRKNIGRKLEIRVDGKPLIAPVVREPILGGAGQISGHFTVQQAHDLAARLNAGTSKLEVEVVK